MKSILKSLYQNSRNEEIKILILNAFNKDYFIRIDIARNLKTPIHILEKLSNDKTNWVRSYVAKNKNTPISVLKKLSKDEDFIVRVFISENPNWIKSRK